MGAGAIAGPRPGRNRPAAGIAHLGDENAADRGQGVILSPVCGHLFVFHRSPADCSENGGFLNMAAGHRLSFSEDDCTS